MKYQTYKLSMEKYYKTAKRQGFKLDRGQTGMHKLMRTLYDVYRDEMTRSPDVHTHLEEFWWLHSGRFMYYPESLELARSMLRATGTIQDEAAFYERDEAFILNFPAGFKLGGADAAGVLVTVCRHDTRPALYMDAGCKWLGLPTVDPDDYRAQLANAGAYSISINYTEAAGARKIVGRIAVDASWLAQVTRISTTGEYAQFLGPHISSDWKERYHDEKSLAVELDLTRVVLNFLLYKKAMPHRIRDGLPGVNRKEVESALVMDRSHKIIGHPAADPGMARTGLTRAPHYRAWHFRQLRDARYYKGEHEGKPPGSRVVMVTDTFIGAATPKTVESNEA